MSEISKSGFDYIEISLDYPWPFRGELKIGEVVQLAKLEGLSVAFHGPWRDIRLSSPIEKVRNASIEVFKSFIEEISNFECEYVVTHLSTDQAFDKIPLIRSEVIDSAVKSIEELSSFAQRLGLRMAFENVKEDLPQFREVVNRTKSEVCLDVSHIICFSSKASKRDDLIDIVARWINEFRDRIKMMHFSGVKFMEDWVRDHLITDENDPFLQLVKRELKKLKIENLLLEIFEDVTHEEVSPVRLENLVKYLRS
ncbi:MAG: sugar phosphate isomerase/epimerase family protein [Nitrososphaerota archaeon]|nr:sugar phosphate isomerase/epimerase family protein [Nitrososphaerota archaeon]